MRYTAQQQLLIRSDDSRILADERVDETFKIISKLYDEKQAEEGADNGESNYIGSE